MLSIVRRGNTYQVRYASFNPYDMDRLPYQCSEEGPLVTLLHHYGIDTWSLQQAVAALRKGEVTVLPVVLSEALLQHTFLGNANIRYVSVRTQMTPAFRRALLWSLHQGKMCVGTRP